MNILGLIAYVLISLMFVCGGVFAYALVNSQLDILGINAAYYLVMSMGCMFGLISLLLFDIMFLSDKIK